jgi:hypothetical protein
MYIAINEGIVIINLFYRRKMTMFINPQNIKSIVPGRGNILFVLMITVIAAIPAAVEGRRIDGGPKTGKPSTSFVEGVADISWYSARRDVFTINTVEELAGIAKLVNERNVSFEGKTINLGRDIVINDTANWRDWANNPPARNWIAIGTCPKRFHGTFDGNGHTISGVYIKNPADDQGLFGVVGHHGTVKRLSVTASYIEGMIYVGILAGGAAGVVTECYTSGIVVGDSIVGGLTGVNDGMINSSYATGSVRGRVNVGGFMGESRLGIVANNHSSSAVSGDSIIGGFVGVNWDGAIHGNFSTGKVTGSASFGGFAGRSYNGMMRNNYYDRTTSGQRDSGRGAGKTTAEMRRAGFVDSLNAVSGILLINAWVRNTGGYPALSDRVADTAGIDRYFASGKGTEDNPYIINTKKQLEDFAMLVNLGVSFSGKHIKLGRNIALNNTTNWQKWATAPPAYTWTPIGIEACIEACANRNRFDGTFDGGGHIVSGAYVDNPRRNGIALFGVISKDATIKNIGVTASYFRGPNTVGGLVGYNAGKIINSYSTAVVAAEETGGDTSCRRGYLGIS